MRAVRPVGCVVGVLAGCMFAAGLLFPAAGSAQAPGSGIEVTPNPRQLTVIAGATSDPVTLRIVASEAAREPRTFTFMVQPPAALAGHVQGQPSQLSVTLAAGQREAVASLRFATQPTAPEGTHSIGLALGTGAPVAQVALVIQRAAGEIRLGFLPTRLQVCQGSEPVRAQLQLRGVGGYRGTPTVTWNAPAGISVNPATVRTGALPPDQQIPFEVSAPGASPGTHRLEVAAVDPGSGARTTAQLEVVVEEVTFAAQAAPANLSLRQGGPDQALGVALASGPCAGTQPARVTLAQLPPGLLVSPSSGVLPGPGSRTVFQVRAAPTAPTGRQTIGIEVVQPGPRGEIRRELQVPVMIEAAAPEQARAPRIERVTPSEVEPGQRVTLELTGQNLGPGVALSFEPAGIQPVAPPVFLSPTRATVEVYVAEGTRDGARTVVAAGAAGTSQGPAQLLVAAARRAPEPEDRPAAPVDEPVDEPVDDPIDEPAEDEPEEEPADEPAPPPGDIHRLDFGGFIVAVTQTDAPDPAAFGGQGVLEEFVFAGRLQNATVDFAFHDLSLESTATDGLYRVLSGETVFEKTVNLSLPLAVAGMAAQISRMALDSDGARIDGRVFLPFVDISKPITDILMEDDDPAGTGTTLPEGFQVIPAVDWGDLLPSFTGGGEVLTFQGSPITSGPWVNAVITEVTVPTLDAQPGFPSFPGLAVVQGAPTGSVTFTDQPLSPEGDFLYVGLAQIDSHPIGQSGVSFTAQQGLRVVVDLSKSENGSQSALNSAYLAWEVAEVAQEGMAIGLNLADPVSPPGVPHTSPQWMGLIFLDAELAAPSVGIQNTSSHVAWVSEGFQTLLAQSFGGQATETVSVQGWEVALLNTALGIRNSVLMDAGALGDVYLPLFGESIRVVLKQTNGGTASMHALGTVIGHYGHTVVFGEEGAFFWDRGALRLGFNEARWAFNENLEAPQPAYAPGHEGDVIVMEGFTTNEDFLKENYQRKFHLKALTLTAGGGASLGGQTEQPLATVPTLDFLNFPFLTGGAWIRLERQGSTYTLGLRGNLELANNLGGLQATTRYRVQNGQELDWTFHGGLSADVNVVHLEIEINGEVDLVNRDVFFNANGAFTIEELFQLSATGAFGRQGSTRYWFLQAGLDFQGTPIVETGFVAFYAFSGGMAHNLQSATSGACNIIDPVAFSQNANQCVNANVPWTFMAGTVLAPSEGFGGDHTVHIEGTLVISAQGSVDILGRGWLLRGLSNGYLANSPPQAAAHVGINKDRFVMTACVGPSGSSQGAPASAQTIDCEGLSPLRYPHDDLAILQIRGWTGFLLDWSTNTYYLAVGHYSNKVEARFFGLAYRKGYMVLAYSPSVPQTWLPPLAGGQVGFYAGREAGYHWDFEHTWSGVCQDNKIWANASLGSESNFFLEFVPFALWAEVKYWVNMGVGADICNLSGEVTVAGDLGADVYVSQALGQLNGSFSGTVRVCGKNNCMNLINISGINVNLTLWEA